MKKLIGRLAIFFLGVPFIFFLIWFFPARHNFIIQIFTLIVEYFCICEVYDLLKLRFSLLPKGIVTTLSMILPLASSLSLTLEMPAIFVVYVAFVLMISLFSFSLFLRKRDESFCNDFLSSLMSLFILLYPCAFLAFVFEILRLPFPREKLLFFLAICFASDSFAWASGKLFGNKNRGIIAVSPNKSVAGFVGAYLAAVILAFLFAKIWPAIFGFGIGKMLAITLITTTATILGDLFESLLKRAVKQKDSGNAVLGRGGMLDSVDSIAFAAPCFYFALTFFESNVL